MPKLSIKQLIVVAALIRFVVAAVSYGTNDPVLWREFAVIVHHVGLLHSWEYNPYLNHPPLPLGWAYLCLLFSGPSFYAFCFTLKIPAILGDLITTRVLWQMATENGMGDRKALWIAALFAFNPIAILISAYHGNTDSLMAALLLCAFRYAVQDRMLLAGLLLGAAINVKLAPMPCVFLLFAGARSWRSVFNAFAGLAICVLPFIPALAVSFEAFVRNALFYKPIATAWGLMLPFSLSPTNLALERFSLIVRGYHTHLTLFAIFGVTFALAWRTYRRRMSSLEAAALFWCFLVVWTTASVQYLVWPLPLLAAVRPRLALWYGLAGGLYIGWRYWEYLGDRFPLISLFTSYPNVVSRWVGLLPWFVLVIAIVSLLRRSRTPSDRSTTTTQAN